MKFNKPISEQNITIPTLQSFLESKRVQNYNITGNSISIPMNVNYYIVLKGLNNKYYMIPMASIPIGAYTTLYSLSNNYNVRIDANNSGTNAIIEAIYQGDPTNLSNAVSEIYTVNPLLEVI